MSSFSAMARMDAGVSACRYTASAVIGSVMIVAGFELTSTTRKPSARSARAACVPE